MRSALLATCLLGLLACSSDEPPPEDHVWRTQTDALKKAKQVEQKAMDNADTMRQRLESIDSGTNATTDGGD